jgi:hypothetical protein
VLAFDFEEHMFFRHDREGGLLAITFRPNHTD